MKKITLLMPLLCATSLSALDVCTSWGCAGLIKDIYSNATGKVLVASVHDEKLANCSPVAGVYFTLDMSKSNAKELYATILSAYMTNKPIQLRVHEGTTGCQIAYVRLSRDF